MTRAVGTLIGARGQAIITFCSWLRDDAAVSADELMAALDLLQLSEADIELVCERIDNPLPVPRCDNVRTVRIPVIGKVT